MSQTGRAATQAALAAQAAGQGGRLDSGKGRL